MTRNERWALVFWIAVAVMIVLLARATAEPERPAPCPTITAYVDATPVGVTIRCT